MDELRSGDAKIDKGIEVFRQWEISCDYHGGHAASELDVRDLVISLFALVDESGGVMGAPHLPHAKFRV
jgi:hypothetical protein